MGGGNSKLQSLKIDSDKWSKVDSNAQFDILRTKQGDQGQKYHFILDETMDIDKEIDIHTYRANTKGNHVKVIGLQTSSESVGLCGKSKTVNVLTERIPTLLTNSRQLNFQQSNIVLYNALKGYSQLYDKFGPCAITDKTIGFNVEGETKVWLNQNFGRNHPNLQNGNLTQVKQSQSQKHMLQTVISLIQKKSQRGIFPEPYRKNVYGNQTFLQSVKWLLNSGIVSQQNLENNKVNLALVQPFQNEKISKNFYEPTYLSPRQGTPKITFNYISPSNK